MPFSLTQLMEQLLVHFQRDRLRAELLCLHDHALRDAGFSRELLLEGVRAWPWQAETEDELPGLDLENVERRLRIIRSGPALARIVGRDVLVA